jgi:hypothetical protein
VPALWRKLGALLLLKEASMRADGLVVACAALSLSGAAAWVSVSPAGLAAGRAGLQNVQKADSDYRRAPEPLQSMRRKRQVQMQAHEHDVPGERYYGPASKPLLDMVKVPADMNSCLRRLCCMLLLCCCRLSLRLEGTLGLR